MPPVREHSSRPATNQRHARPHAVVCFAGVCGTSVPLRVDENLVGFLKTDAVLFNRPTERDFALAVRQLADWGFRSRTSPKGGQQDHVVVSAERLTSKGAYVGCSRGRRSMHRTYFKQGALANTGYARLQISELFRSFLDIVILNDKSAPRSSIQPSCCANLHPTSSLPTNLQK